jgi:hypothetical protein
MVLGQVLLKLFQIIWNLIHQRKMTIHSEEVGRLTLKIIKILKVIINKIQAIFRQPRELVIKLINLIEELIIISIKVSPVFTINLMSLEILLSNLLVSALQIKITTTLI